MEDLGHLVATLDSEADVLRALRHAETLALAAASETSVARLAPVFGLLVNGDPLASVAAVHAVSRVTDDVADAVLGEALGDDRAIVREHAAWGLSARIPARHVQPRLANMVAAGGFAGMLAQRTLVGWSRSDPEGVSLVVLGALAATTDPGVRMRLVETLVDADVAWVTSTLVDLARDDAEDLGVRAAAVAELGTRRGPDVVRLLVDLSDGPLGGHALLALDDLAADGGGSERSADGLRIGQLYVHAELDPQLAVTAAGDRGGIASLLVSLGTALAEHPDVDQVLTIGRGSVDDTLMSLMEPPVRGLTYAAVPVGPDSAEPPSLTEAWPYRLQLERDIRRVLRRRPRLDVLHLRMADVGTLAAASVARRMAIPIAFSAAPDPHGPIRQAQRDGHLDRDRFADADRTDHLWFRARMVERMIATCDRLAVFPRPDLRRDLGDMLGLDVVEDAHRVQLVPEGIDLDRLAAAERRIGRGDVSEPVVDELRAAIRRLSPERVGLPLLVTAGRLHPAKGTERVVAAWVDDVDLQHRCNLVVVGGDLERPNAVEREVLDAIATITAHADGLILLGRRSHSDTLATLCVAARGAAPEIAPGGVYVDGAAKEEFGLALVEALAAGLPVVGPASGGPAVYVDDGHTGVLAAATEPLGSSIRTAFDLVDLPGRAEAARAMVADRYTVDAMAAALVDLYRRSPAVVR